MAESLYASCAQVLSLCQANKDDLETLLHPETGFAPRLREICNQQYVLRLLSVENLEHTNIASQTRRIARGVDGGECIV